MELIKIYRCDLAFRDKVYLPESVFDKIELYDLKLSSGKQIEPFIELTFDEFKLIENILIMERIKIKVSDYYGNPSYYSVMPQTLFDLFEAATLNGEEYVLADKGQIEKMINDYKLKMKSNE